MLNVVLSDVWQGGEGAVDLANEIVKTCRNDKPINQILWYWRFFREKLNKIVKRFYGGFWC